MSEAPVLALEGLGHGFVQGGSRLTVLKDASLSVAAGESVGVVAPSGAGKSTLLHIAGLLERPEQGRVRILGTASDGLGERGRTRLRRSHIGFVYQFHHLLPEFSARENLIVPQLIAGRRRSAARERADSLLAAVELGDRADHRPARLSGGEQQRVAIARALANNPDLLLADEPTGNLDPATSERVFATLLAQVRDHGVAAVIATHSAELAARLDRKVALRTGGLVAA